MAQLAAARRFSAQIDLDWTLAQLGIDDNEPSLNALEKSATVRQLLQARSGVYHPALYESKGMKAARPARHSHAPGTFWYCNNWDFNALGTIFRNATRRDIYRAFAERIAHPIGMQDFALEELRYFSGPDSVHPAYPFRLSARDMARFGLLFLRAGRWRGRQIVPRAWVAESTRAFSDAGERGGYGYLWWVAARDRHYPGVALPAGSYSARGWGGHHIVVIPALDLVVVHRANTFERGRRVSREDFGALLAHILAAAPGR